MKKFILLTVLICGFLAVNAQKTTPGNYTYIAQQYEWIPGIFQGLGLPAGSGPAAFRTGQVQRAGAVYYDSLGADAGFYFWDGVAWVLQGSPGAVALPDELIQPGYVVYSGTGLKFYISPSIARIGGVIYGTDYDSVTLSASDPDDPRKDVIYVATTGIEVLEGTPAGPAAEPQLDAGQLKLTVVDIQAGATTPGLTQNIIWDENTESVVTNVGTTTDPDNLTNVYHLTKSINVSNIGNGDQIIITLPSTIDATAYDALVLFLKAKALIPTSTTSIRVTLFNGATQVSTEITLGHDGTSLDYRGISLPISRFQFNNTFFDVIRIRWTTSAAVHAGFYADYVYLVSGLPQPGGSGTPLTVGPIGAKSAVPNGAIIENNVLYTPLGTQTNPGLISGPDKTKLDSIRHKYFLVNGDEPGNSLMLQVNDSTAKARRLIFVGADVDSTDESLTVTITGGGGGLSEIIAGYGLQNVNDSTLDVDSLVIANRDWVMDRIAEGVGGANTALSNLASVAVNTSLISDTDITDDLGSSSISWKDVFANVLKAGNGSISAPSISFKNSTNTGFYYTSADAGSLWLTLQGFTLGRLGFQHPTSSTFNQGNTFLGYEAGSLTGSVGSANSFHNTFIGGIAGKANTTGNQNTGIGSRALSSNTTGNQNTAVGQGSFFNAATVDGNAGLGFHAGLEVLGANNVAIGSGALKGAAGSTAAQSTAVGMQALTLVTTAANNTALGRLTLGSLTTSPNNTGSGLNAGFLITTGSGGNTLNGYQAGYEITTGAYNTIIGAAAQAPSATGSGQLNIGNVIYGSGLHQSTSRTSTPTATGSIGIGLTTPTARLMLPAGTATASTAPLKFTSGTNLTTAEAGVFEYNGSNFFATATATNRRQLVISNVATPSNGFLPIGNGTDFTLAAIAEGQNINVTNGAGSITFTGSTLTKNATIENPGAAENIGWFRTPVAITITNTHAVLVGSGSPSVTYQVSFGTDITSLTDVYSAGQTVTSVTTGTAASGVNDATIPANSWVRITTSAQSGTVGQISLSITYTED